MTSTAVLLCQPGAHSATLGTEHAPSTTTSLMPGDAALDREPVSSGAPQPLHHYCLPVPANYHSTLADPNWRTAMVDE
jgi:hypothetical protein